jgi:hypothetical protein
MDRRNKPHRRNPKVRHLIALLAAGLLLAALPAGAQTATAPDVVARAQQLYEREVAACNAGTLPAPEREACLRVAGLRYDRARGVPPVEEAVTTPDGRATVVAPIGATPPSAPANVPPTETTRDGRATIVR